MTGSGKEKHKPLSDDSVSGRAAPLIVQAPDVSHFVLPGLPLGLIHRTKLATDQIVTIATWDAENPTPETEYFKLQYARRGSEEWEVFEEHSVKGPMEPADWKPLVFTISSTWLENDHEGPWDLRYEHLNFSGVTDHSDRVPIEIDTIAPNQGVAPDAMTFTIPFPITDATFASVDHFVGTLPAFKGSLVDVQLYYTWHKGLLPEKPEDMKLKGPIPAVSGGTVDITEEMVVVQGDGACTGGFVLEDKAGNVIISKWDLKSVALGPLPVPPLAKPTLADATGGELVRSDIVNGGAMVNVPYIANGKSTDTIVVKFKDTKLEPGTPVGGNPANGIDIFLPWSIIWETYESYAQVGVVDIDLQYELLRGVEPFASAVETVKCNLSAPGPGPIVGIPTPEPGNPRLKQVTIVGKSGVDNVLIDTDEDEDANAFIELVAPLVLGDKYQAVWDGKPIGQVYVITATDNVGDIIKIALDWDTIRAAGPSATKPVWYELTNDDHENPQEPDPRTAVDIAFLVIKLPEAVAQHLSANGFLSCDSLRWNAGASSFGFEYVIPPSQHLKAGDEVKATWKAYTDYFGTPTEVVSARQEFTFSNISEEQAQSGIKLLVEPYADKILPVWSKDVPVGKGEITYVITGVSGGSIPTNTKVSLSQGETSCTVPPPSNP